MRIGVDFDNTIVCYDALFHKLGTERALVGPEVRAHKQSVRDALRAAGREDAWTEMQGLAYGDRMPEATAFEGVHAFFAACRSAQIPVFIISHKTRQPYRGTGDLHGAARDWLARQGFHDPAGIGLPGECVYLEETLDGKLARIAERHCTHFIDDLPELLGHADFPPAVERLLFDPADSHAILGPFPRARSWAALQEHLLGSPCR